MWRQVVNYKKQLVNIHLGTRPLFLYHFIRTIFLWILLVKITFGFSGLWYQYYEKSINYSKLRPEERLAVFKSKIANAMFIDLPKTCYPIYNTTQYTFPEYRMRILEASMLGRVATPCFVFYTTLLCATITSTHHTVKGRLYGKVLKEWYLTIDAARVPVSPGLTFYIVVQLLFGSFFVFMLLATWFSPNFYRPIYNTAVVITMALFKREGSDQSNGKGMAYFEVSVFIF